MTLALIMFAIALGLFAAIITFALLSHINAPRIKETETQEALGDMVDVRAILKKWEDA